MVDLINIPNIYKFLSVKETISWQRNHHNPHRLPEGAASSAARLRRATSVLNKGLATKEKCSASQTGGCGSRWAALLSLLPPSWGFLSISRLNPPVAARILLLPPIQPS